jgi:GDPmannose 4,6-dehydratase
MFACCGIIFNHESPRRGHEFVTRKITHTAARINYNQATELRLGNLDAKRDWSHAADMAEAMWMMLQHHEAKDFVFASGETHTVREFVELAFGRMGMDYQKYVKIDPKFFRPAEVEILLGDASLAYEELGWKPKISFEQLVHDMVDADMRLIGNTFV